MTRVDLAVAAERTLIGSLNVDAPLTLRDAGDLVGQADFFDGTSGEIWAAALELRALGQPVELATLGPALARAGSRVNIVELAARLVHDGWPSLATLYAQRVRREAARRRLLVGLDRAQRKLAKGEEEPDEVADTLDRLAGEARAGVALPATAANAPAIFAEVVDAAAALGSGARQAGLRPVADPLVSHVFAPLLPGDLCVIGGRPGSGKSHLCGDWAFGWARAAVPGIILTAEDSPALWVLREAAKASGLEAWQIREGKLDVAGWTALHDTQAAARALPLRIDRVRDARQAAASIRAAARGGARFAIVDHLQRLGADREEEVARAVDVLKRASAETGTPVVLVSQVRRGRPEDRGRCPDMHDLWGSGRIEAAADVVLMIWRPRPDKDYSRCRISRAKWRHGPPAKVEVNWLPQQRRWWPLPVKGVVDEEDNGG